MSEDNNQNNMSSNTSNSNIPDTNSKNAAVTKTAKEKNFSDSDSINLTRSGVFVSTDPITGNGQKGNTFWERIAKDFNRFIINKDFNRFIINTPSTIGQCCN